MGLKECTSDAPCPFHERWAIIRDEFYALLLNEKLSDLTEALLDTGQEASDLRSPRIILLSWRDGEDGCKFSELSIAEGFDPSEDDFDPARDRLSFGAEV